MDSLNRLTRPPPAAKNACSFAASFTPGADSTPDDTSIMCGCTGAIASRTFAAFSPPDRIVCRRARHRRGSVQSIVRPVPPRRTGSCASSSTVTPSGRSSIVGGIERVVTATALISGCRHANEVVDDSLPWSCTAPSGTRSATSITLTHWLIDEHANRREVGGSIGDDLSRTRGIAIPRARRPENEANRRCSERTASWASSARQMPHTFTRGPLINYPEGFAPRTPYTLARALVRHSCPSHVPTSSRNAAPGSAWAIRRSPTRNASYPTRDKRAMSSLVRMPLSATFVVPRGNCCRDVGKHLGIDGQRPEIPAIDADDPRTGIDGAAAVRRDRESSTSAASDKPCAARSSDVKCR